MKFKNFALFTEYTPTGGQEVGFLNDWLTKNYDLPAYKDHTSIILNDNRSIFTNDLEYVKSMNIGGVFALRRFELKKGPFVLFGTTTDVPNMIYRSNDVKMVLTLSPQEVEGLEVLRSNYKEFRVAQKNFLDAKENDIKGDELKNLKRLMNASKKTISLNWVKTKLSYNLEILFGSCEQILYYSKAYKTIIALTSGKREYLSLKKFFAMLDKLKASQEHLPAVLDKMILPDLFRNNEVDISINFPKYLGEASFVQFEEAMSFDTIKTVEISGVEPLAPVKESILSAMIATASSGAYEEEIDFQGTPCLMKTAIMPENIKYTDFRNQERVQVEEKRWKTVGGLFVKEYKNFKVLE